MSCAVEKNKLGGWRTGGTAACARRGFDTLISVGSIRAVTGLVSGYSGTTVCQSKFCLC